MTVMKKLNASIGMLLGGFLVLASPQDPTAPGQGPSVVVGTFDSRAVLIAYVRSGEFKSYLAAQKENIEQAAERARTVGDRALVEELDALGPAMQRRIRQSGFGTAPIDDIIARIKDKLPDIAKQAGVDVIVSKWTLTYKSPEAKFVDVSLLLANGFDPDEETLKAIRGIMAQEPIPLDQLKDDHK
jgi:hypothetical protein